MGSASGGGRFDLTGLAHLSSTRAVPHDGRNHCEDQTWVLLPSLDGCQFDAGSASRM